MESELPFRQSHALVVGIDGYDRSRGIEPLRSAVLDARELHRVLKHRHGFDVTELVDADTSTFRASLAALAMRVTAEDRVLFYFAGHGLWRDDDGGPGGYVLMRDAHAGKPSTLVAMREVSEVLAALPCRHLLVVLDCCYGGAFRWSSSRDFFVANTVSRQRYERYIEAAAWQAITSAGPDQVALDGFGQRDVGDGAMHSPFAEALIAALEGKADVNGDGLITATELYLYVRGCVEDETDHRRLQSPGLFPLRKHDRGEFVFRTPGRPLKLPRAEELTLAHNPYRGLLAFEESDSQFYFGRTRAATALAKTVLRHPLTVVAGASGTGKSSLVKAGLVPALRRRAARAGKRAWRVLGPYRPSEPIDPLLDEPAPPPDTMTVVVIDQLEELLVAREPTRLLENLARWIAAAPERVRVIVTIRSDFEPLLADGPLEKWWQAGRFVVPPMSLDELRGAIERPADLRDLHFEPSRLVDQIATEVVQMPGALPLLSFTLSELYRMYCTKARTDRTLRESDYRELGGVASSVTKRADAEYASLTAEPAYERTVKNVMMRAVQEIGGERARRRIARLELRYADAAENERVEKVLKRYVDARLFVVQSSEGRQFYEPAHDALIRGWPRLLRWLDESSDERALLRAVEPAALAWAERRSKGDLWDDNTRLPQLAALVETPAHPLNALELDFTRQSIQRRRALRARRFGLTAGAFAIIAGVAVVALIQRSHALEAREAEARGRTRAEKLVDHMAYDLPTLLQALGQFGRFRETTDRIAEYYAELRAETPALDLDQRRRLVAGLNALANLKREQGELAEAAKLLSTTLMLGEALAAENPNDRRVQRDLYVAHMGLNAVATTQQRWADATSEARRAREIADRLLAAEQLAPPALGKANIPLDRASAMLREAEVAVRTGDPTARAQVEECVAELEQLVAADANDRASAIALVHALKLLTSIMDPESEGEARAARVVHIRTLVTNLPTSPFDAQIIDEVSSMKITTATGIRDMLHSAIFRPDMMKAMHGQLASLYDMSIRELGEACSDRHMLRRLDATNVELQRAQVACSRTFAEVAAAVGDLRNAELRLSEAWEVQRGLEAQPTVTEEVRRDGCMLLDLAAVGARQRGDSDTAQRLFSEALKCTRRATASATDLTSRVDVAISLFNLAEIEVDRGKLEEARKLYDEALSLCTDPAACAGIRTAITDAAKSAGAIPFTLKMRVKRATGLDTRIPLGSVCALILRPAPPKVLPGCAFATVSCNNWRLVGGLAMQQIALTTECSVPVMGRLDLERRTLHLDGTAVFGPFTLDAAVE